METIQKINGRTSILKECDQCATGVWRRLTHVGNRTFCSIKCRSQYLTKSIEVSCAFCTKIVSKKPSTLQRSKSGNIFCNRSCATKYNNQFKIGELHGNWNGGDYRQNALKHYGARCINEDCILSKFGITIPVEMIDVDHIDSNRSNNEIKNLQPLCVWCHALKTRKVAPALDDE